MLCYFTASLPAFKVSVGQVANRILSAFSIVFINMPQIYKPGLKQVNKFGDYKRLLKKLALIIRYLENKNVGICAFFMFLGGIFNKLGYINQTRKKMKKTYSSLTTQNSYLYWQQGQVLTTYQKCQKPYNRSCINCHRLTL